MITKRFAENYRMTERHLPDDYVILSGQYAWDHKEGHTMDLHIQVFIGAGFEIVSHTRFGIDGREYQVIMRKK